jgi:hypothetical protein
MNSLWTFEMMTLCLSHIENEKCGLKKYVIFISKSNIYIYIYIYIYIIRYYLCQFFTNDIPFHIEIFKIFLKFFGPITCLEIFIRWPINICDQNHKG